MKGMIIWGDSFCFSVREPDEWYGVTENAYQHEVNVYFLRDSSGFSDAPAVMSGRVMYKSGLSVKEHLKADMNHYKKNDKMVSFESFSVKDMEYEIATRKYIIDRQTCDYLCYIDPGKNVGMYLIFVLSTNMHMCNDYVDMFKHLLKSFKWMGAEVMQK